MKRKKILAGVIVLLCLLAGSAMAVSGPTEQLKPTLASLTALLADSSLKGDVNKTVRREKIMHAIKEGFDFKEMSRRILGPTWNEINVADQEYFIAQMTKLLENVYIGKLESYTGQAIEYVGERVRDGRAQVSTVVEHQGAKIPLSYIMSENGQRWMVYDINIEGVSLVRNYMEQFKSILRTDKFPGLIKVLEEKNRSFAAGGSGQ